MRKLKRLIIKVALTWAEARKAYARRYINHRLGS
jgi:hypothetical protein